MSEGRQTTGRRGEEFARQYFDSQGYEIVAQNARVGRHKEIDLIVREGDALVFVEVKTRSTDRYGAPEAQLRRAQLETMERALGMYLQRHPAPTARIDVVSVLIPLDDSRPQLKHFRNVRASDCER